MREIKFRAWDYTQNKMIDWQSMQGWAMGSLNSGENKMQFIGLLDKNGKEIYERDICSGHSDGNGRIVWQEGEYVYEFNDEAVVGLWEAKPLEIIGNIYENPELITP